MAKDIIPKGRGLTAEEVSRPILKFVPNKEPTVDPTQLVIVKVIEAEKGYSVVQTEHSGKLRLSGGTLSWRNNNPGNIKYGNFAISNGAVDKGHVDMAVFKTYEDGVNAQKVLVFSPNSKYYNMTLMDAIKTYAPEYDNNNPKAYANYIAKKAGINKETKLSKLTLIQQERMLKAMFEMEGYKTGTVQRLV